VQQEQILIPNHFRDFFFFFFLHILLSTCVVQQLLYTKTVQRRLLATNFLYQFHIATILLVSNTSETMLFLQMLLHQPCCKNYYYTKKLQRFLLATNFCIDHLSAPIILIPNTSETSSSYRSLASNRDIATILIPNKHLKARSCYKILASTIVEQLSSVLHLSSLQILRINLYSATLVIPSSTSKTFFLPTNSCSNHSCNN